MSLPGNSSEWIAAGREHGIDLSFLEQDKERIYDFLREHGIPYPRSELFDGGEFSSSDVEAVMRDYGLCFVRLIPHDGGHRPNNTFDSPETFRTWCASYEMSQYRIHIVDKGEVTHTFGIVAEDTGRRRCVIELVEGDGPQLFHGEAEETVVGRIGWTPLSAARRIPTFEIGRRPTAEERTLVSRALDHIGGGRTPLAGYFEGEVRGRQDIVFRNYQKPGSAYANLLR